MCQCSHLFMLNAYLRKGPLNATGSVMLSKVVAFLTIPRSPIPRYNESPYRDYRLTAGQEGQNLSPQHHTSHTCICLDLIFWKEQRRVGWRLSYACPKEVDKRENVVPLVRPRPRGLGHGWRRIDRRQSYMGHPTSSSGMRAEH